MVCWNPWAARPQCSPSTWIREPILGRSYRLTHADYDAASFLDERVLGTGASRRILRWQQVNDSLGALGLGERRCQFIFHIGHVGSTLLSRLIGAQPLAFSLREPLILRTLARLATEPTADPPVWSGADFELRLAAGLQLLSRTFDGQQQAVVKATSFVSEAAHTLLARPSAPRALMMFVGAESYLATILGGPNSRQEARILAPKRLQRLHRRIGQIAQTVESLSEGEAVALGWACEMTALAEAAKSAGDRVLKIDFEHFLGATGDIAIRRASPPRDCHCGRRSELHCRWPPHAALFESPGSTPTMPACATRC